MMQLLAGAFFVAAVIAFLQGAQPAETSAADPKSAAVMAPGIISTGKEFGLTFTPNGREAYFTRFDSVKKINHIYRSILVDAKWEAPTPVSFSSDTYSDLDASLSPDGKKLFFISTRPKPGAIFDPAKKDMDIWVAHRNNEGWDEPRWLDNINSTSKEGSPSVARDGTLYFFSDRDAPPNTNSIYAAKLRNGQYVAPSKLPTPVNSDSSDTSPFISPDGKTLLFYSTRQGGYGGADLYVCYLFQGAWTTPQNLGPAVNTKDWEYNPSVSPDGQTLYFGRNRQIYLLSIADLGSEILTPRRFRR
jgi:Tol biopolymer transport system component